MNNNELEARIIGLKEEWNKDLNEILSRLGTYENDKDNGYVQGSAISLRQSISDLEELLK